MLEKDKIQEAYERSILGRGVDEGKEIMNESINEASEVKFDEINPENQKLVTSLVGKGKEENQSYWDGIHGQIVDFLNVGHSKNLRMKKADLKKLLSDKNVRWVDISSIGF